ncbi:MAG: hypothetical protein QOH11_2107 [Solirubrobacteraceae bacterium]|nr:hypothetical protein [Solirubrobacteraceae bacterium]
MNKLPVTVVIPAYRRPDMVARAVRSALAQSAPPDEVIVVDDASGDGTGDSAAALGARVIGHEENRGEGAARNTGLSGARNPWVALLDSDDEWLSEHLETLWAARDGHILASTLAIAADPMTGARGLPTWSGRRPFVMTGPAAVMLPENRVTPSAVLLDRATALAAGGFRTAMPRAADLDLWVRVLERGTGVIVPRATVIYHVHHGQVTTDRAAMRVAAVELLDRYASAGWCTPAVRRRREGALAWDDLRAAEDLRGALRSAARIAMSPRRVQGTAHVLAARLLARRAAARLASSGDPSPIPRDRQ